LPSVFYRSKQDVDQDKATCETNTTDDPSLSCHCPTSPTIDLDCDPALIRQQALLSPAATVNDISSSEIETADVTPKTPSTVDEKDVAHTTYALAESNLLSSRETVQLSVSQTRSTRRRRVSSDELSPSPNPLRYVVFDCQYLKEASCDPLLAGVVGVHWLTFSSEVPFLLVHFKDRSHGKRRRRHSATVTIETTNRYFTSAWRCSSSSPSFSDTWLDSGVRQSLVACS
jgi:hypothetical protein